MAEVAGIAIIDPDSPPIPGLKLKDSVYLNLDLHYRYSKGLLEGAGDWLVESPEFGKWHTRKDGQLLWGYGIRTLESCFSQLKKNAHKNLPNSCIREVIS